MTLDAPLDEPLLPACDVIVEDGVRRRADTFAPCAFNLGKVIMGAGMMAVPKAFFLMGFPLGTAILLGVLAITVFSLVGLITASEQTGAFSYHALARRTLGPAAETLLQVAVFVNCWVMNVVFLVVIGDILIGGGSGCDGLICELTGVNTGWLADRRVMLGAMSLLVLAPLASMRDMSRLAVMNIVGMASNGVFAAATLALAVAALARGRGHALTLWPQWDLIGHGSSSPLVKGMGLANILPILLNCDVCHMSLHPLMALLKPYSHARMRALVATTLSGCNVLYWVVALGCGLAFGASLRSDVLANINTDALAPLLGAPAALAVALLVRTGYLFSLTGSYVLLWHPIRDVLAHSLLPAGWLSQGPRARRNWLLLTWGLCALTYGVSCYVPSIWALLALAGSTTSTVQAFIVPGLIILATHTGRGRGLHRALAWALVVMGSGLFINGLAQEGLRHRDPGAAPSLGAAWQTWG